MKLTSFKTLAIALLFHKANGFKRFAVVCAVIILYFFLSLIFRS